MEFQKIEDVEGLDLSYLGVGYESVEVLFDEQKAKAIEETLNRYEKLRRDEETFKVRFTGSTPENNLFMDDGGVRLLLPLENAEQLYPKRMMSKPALIRQLYDVKVSEVDRKSGTVYLNCFSKMSEARKKYFEVIEKNLKEKKMVRLGAKVMYVNETARRLIVDIGGVGILGVLGLGDWSNEYTTSFKNIVKPGELIPVVVTGRTAVKKMRAYSCSRKLAVKKDSWAGIEQRYPVNTLVVVKCVNKRQKSYFGKMEGLDDIEVFCEYPANHSVIVDEECYYQGIVTRVSEEKRMLKVKTINKVEGRIS